MTAASGKNAASLSDKHTSFQLTSYFWCSLIVVINVRTYLIDRITVTGHREIRVVMAMVLKSDVPIKVL